MFNIKRYDPSQPSSSNNVETTIDSTSALNSLTEKIQERQRKRKALEESTESTSASTSAIIPAVVSVVEEWKPAAGESPAEREKREKREKRALKLNSLNSIASTSTSNNNQQQDYNNYNSNSYPVNNSRGVQFDLVPMPATGSTYNEERDIEMSNNNPGTSSIHPSRLAHVPGAKKEKKEKDLDKEKTPAKKKYLKRKKERSKGKKAGEPATKPKRIKLSKEALEAERLAGFVREEGDSSSSEEDEDDYKEKEDALNQKKLDIIKKKEERKLARDVKKQAARDLRANGGVALPIIPRVLPTPSTIVISTPTEIEIVEEESTPIELSLEAIQRQERLAAKRQKREKRRGPRSPSPPPASSLIPTGASTTSPTSTSTFTIIEAPSTTAIKTSLPTPSPEPESIPRHLQSADPVPLASQGPFVEPEPLLRLPGATRPAPPSTKELSKLKIHSSVADKFIVNPESKLSISGGELGLSDRGMKRLGEMGVTEAFAVQTAVFPFLLPEGEPRTLYAPFSPPRDLCVSAPTGSGKTLSYVVPIVETLSGRVVTRLRALILLPTRDLVAQVRETFELFSKGTGLKIGTATGQHSFAHEQVSLVGELVPKGLLGGTSQVDILIATPGRLMDHLRSTEGFSLQHLRYLVIDEADRLLNQSFHDWLPSILSSLKPPTLPSSTSIALSSLTSDKKEIPLASTSSDCLAPEWWDQSIGRVSSDLDERCLPSCQKLLFSATLSRDPAKIDALHLNRPIYVSVEDDLDPNLEEGEEIDEELKFTLPATLKEHMIVSPSTHKPLYLFHLLHTLSLSSALCFTKSVEAATRLAKLVEFFEEARSAADPEAKKAIVSSYSSDLPPSERTRILASFKKGEIQMLVCSDLISRGIDLPHVSHVISYDVPTDMRKYVHRVGRTARAGMTGDAWSLVENQEAAPFKAIMTSAQHLQKIERVRVKDQAVEPFVPHYQVALLKLQSHFSTGKPKVD